MNARLTDLIASVEAGVPVLRATAPELARMEREQDRLSANVLSAAILRDPLMTLRVLRFLQSHRTRSQTADITTIAHALMMLGLARFFREFGALPILEDQPSVLYCIAVGKRDKSFPQSLCHHSLSFVGTANFMVVRPCAWLMIPAVTKIQ